MAEKNLEFGKRLNQFLFEAGLNKKRLAEMIDISPSAIGAYINEGRIPEAPILFKIAQSLNKTMEDILFGESALVKEPAVCEGVSSYSNERFIKADVFILAGAGSPKDLTEQEAIDTVVIPKDFYSPSIIPIKIKGRSMEPLIFDGAFVGVDKAERDVVSGEIYAIWIPYEGAVIKRLFVEIDNVTVRSENPIFPTFSIPFKDIHNDNFILGRVKWVIQKL